MTATIAAYGRLGQDPKAIETRTGKPMTVASLAVDVADPRDRENGGDSPPLWLDVVAFGKLADALARHAKGDPVSVSGRLQLRRYEKGGEAREGWQCIADSILSARIVRQGGGRKTNGKPAAGDRARQQPHGPQGPEPPPLDDDIPF